MFFEIKKNPNPNFPHQFKLNDNLFLNCDQGWSKYRTVDSWIFYKGYNDTNLPDLDFIDLVNRNPIPTHTGNFFAVIARDNGTIVTTHDLFRGTPLRRSGQNFLITNLPIEGTINVWADRILEISPSLEINEVFFNPYHDVEQFDKLSDEQIIDSIDTLLNESFETFLTKNTKPVKIFLSGGMDTTTCFSYLNKFTNNFEIIAGEIFEFTPFVCSNRGHLKKLWGYNQFHHFRDPSALVTGGNGDEMFIRSPTTVNMILSAHETDVLTEMRKNPSCYHYSYFMLPGNQQKYQQQAADPEFLSIIKNWEHTVQQVNNQLLHDHQHWHLENTLTFTPLKDLRYTNLILRGSLDLIKAQVTDSEINRQLIAKNDPSLLQYVSTQKNNNTQEHQWAFYERFRDRIKWE